jgi:hypothetical protein
MSNEKESVNKYNKKEHYQKIVNKSLESAILLNKIIRGKSVEDYSDEEMSEAIRVQADIVSYEEIKEWCDNFGYDVTEELDACCDVLYTVPYLHYLIDEARKRENVMVNHKRIALVTTMANLVLSNLMLGSDGTYNLIEEAVDRVIENNMAKVTTSKAEFKKWKAPANEHLTKSIVVVDDVTYYMLKNEHGKVRKREGFPTVELGDLLEKHLNVKD